jgi:tetratricopeptide (TPR) repeat protein
VPNHPEAHDLTMQAWSLWQRQNAQDNLRARALLERALALDPSSALAWAGLANTHISEIYIDRTLSRERPLRAAAQAAERAYQLDPTHINALGSLGTVRAIQGRFEESAGLMREQLRINPNYAPSEMWLGIIMIQLGEFEEAARHAQRAVRLSPRDPRLTYFHSVISTAYLHAGHLREALEAAERAQEAPGPNRYAPVVLAAVAMRAGDSDRARRVMADFVQANPGYTVAILRQDEALWRPKFREREERRIADLRAAGLPER